jgi:hypothetical protein
LANRRLGAEWASTDCVHFGKPGLSIAHRISCGWNQVMAGGALALYALRQWPVCGVTAGFGPDLAIASGPPRRVLMPISVIGMSNRIGRQVMPALRTSVLGGQAGRLTENWAQRQGLRRRGPMIRLS